MKPNSPHHRSVDFQRGVRFGRIQRFLLRTSCFIFFALFSFDHFPKRPHYQPITSLEESPKVHTAQPRPYLKEKSPLVSTDSKDQTTLQIQSNSGNISTALRVDAIYDRLPLIFEPNRGQINADVKFISRGIGHALILTSTEAIMSLQPASRMDAVHDMNGTILEMDGDHYAKIKESKTERNPVVLRMKLEHSNPDARVAGVDVLPGRSNYLVGNDRSKWRTGVPHYAKVKYENIYPGIDLIFYGNGQHLEYDFVIAPGANPKDIRLSFDGADGLQMNERGDLVLHTILGEVNLRQPVIYQDKDGERERVEGRYVIAPQSVGEYFAQSSSKTQRVSFEVAEYDATRPLVIDPVLVYSTYFGSPERLFASATVSSVAVDSAGNAYITGQTASDQFPTTTGALMTSRGADGCPLPPCADAFVSKFSPQGQLVYSTYLGGNSEDGGTAIAVSSDGHVYVTGRTVSTDFPVTANAFQTAPGGLSDAFVVKLNPEGSALIYSTYLGGNGNESAAGIAIDTAGNAYIAGETLNYLSPDPPPAILFPSTPGAFQSICPQSATGAYCGGVFLTKLNATGSALVYSSFLGGTDGYSRVFGIAVDASEQAHVFGTTSSRDFPIMNAFQSICHACAYSGDVFLTKFNPAGSGLVYSTYLGGSLGNGIYGGGITIDPSGNAYVTSWTASPDFPTTDGAFKEFCDTAFTLEECDDSFVAKFGPTGGIVYSTILGQGQSAGIAVDTTGNAYVTGRTSSQIFPLANALQTTCLTGTIGYCWDIFVTRLNVAGSGLVYSTYLGGGSVDQAKGIAVDSVGNAVVAGGTVSHDFPIVNPVQDNCDTCPPPKIFVTKLASLSNPSVYVVCPAASLQAALINAQPGNIVSVSGSCNENVLIANDKQRIALDGGGTATINGVNLNSPVLNVRGKGILIQGFTITGGSDGIHINRGSNTVVNNNLIESTNGNGVAIDEMSVAVISSNTIQNNPGAGIFVSEGSTARIGFNADTETTASANTIQSNSLGVVISNSSSARIIGNAIQNNGGDGVLVTRDSQADIASNAIDGNGGNGVGVGAGSAVQLGEDSGTSIYEAPNTTMITNAGFGIHCSGRGAADGRRGSLTGASGGSSFDGTCLDSLMP